jgi:NADH-quinone oxidoreductase subunit K
VSLLVLTSALLCLGLYGVLTRRDLVALLASVEVMLGAGTIQLAAFSTTLVAKGASSGAAAAAGQGYTLAIMVLAAAEAAVGLALLVVLVRSGRTRTDQIEEVRG